MGQSTSDSLSKMMKFVVLALVAAAAAEPEADSQFYSYAAPTAYSTTYNRAFPYSAYFPYSNFYSHAFPYSYATHHMTKRDAEAEPQTFTPYYQSAWPYTYPQTAYTNTHHLLPAVRTVAAPVVRTVAAPVVHTVASPLLKTLMPAAHRTYASVSALPTHHITNYNNAEQFTAHSNGVFGPKYIAKNGPVEHIVKREAEAEPEADAQYPYFPIHNTYSHVAPVATYNNVAPIPSTYSNIAPITSTYKHVAPIPSTYSHVAPMTSTYSHVAPINTNGHQVALTHPSNVGVCLNNMGIQVPC